MATLILTTVGSVLGGPIGGALGALAGQALDQSGLFKPKGREGPRLTELAVQTSSYGAQIPRLFGTMRVAGTVIWSTDLVEDQQRTGGKGQPDVTSYSYSVSFAVLLSARRIVGIGRIWADGKLLRGAAGDFKSATGFRLYLGDEAQAVDPLIGSAEGAQAPAHRGCAYAVFEHFALADYGNRIPSLTFEVIADAAPVALGAIAEDLSQGLVDGRAVTTPLPGFSAYGGTVRAMLETIAVAGGAWFAPAGGGLAMRDGGASPRSLADDGVAATGQGAQRARARAAIETVPQTITIGHYDPARDYQTGLQRARRPGAGLRSERLEMPAALSAGAAKAIAEAALARAEHARERRQLALDWSAIDVLPGDTVSIAGDPARWRVASWSLEAMVVRLDLVRLPAAAPSVDRPASPGRVLGSPDLAHGPTTLHAFELPPIDDSVPATPRLHVAAAGVEAGWRRASLLYSLDGGGQWIAKGQSAAPAVIGSLASVPAAGSASLYDLTTVVEVTLGNAAMTLTSANDSRLDAGGNLALVGEELIQFGRAEQIDSTRWRLSRLLRGRRGTEAAQGRQVIGDRFVLIEPAALVTINLPTAAIGTAVGVMASGVGDDAGPVLVGVPVSGISVVPPSPVQCRVVRDGDGLLLRWARRSRAGWRWIDSTDAPLVEERETYRVLLSAPGRTDATIETALPELAVDAAWIVPGASATIRQLGTNGPSPPVQLMIA